MKQNPNTQFSFMLSLVGRSMLWKMYGFGISFYSNVSCLWLTYLDNFSKRVPFFDKSVSVLNYFHAV